jgi:hypothetical protein
VGPDLAPLPNAPAIAVEVLRQVQVLSLALPGLFTDSL